MFPKDIVCLRNMSINTLHKVDDDDDDDNDNNNNNWISSREQPTRGGPPAWVLGEVLTNARRKNLSYYVAFKKASELNW